MAGFLVSKLVQHWEAIGAALLRNSAPARDQAASFPLATWGELAGHGLFSISPGVTASTSHHETVASALYGLAKGSLDLPFSASAAAHLAIASDLLHVFGTEGQKKRYGAGFADGSVIGAICNTETGCGSDLKLMKSYVTPEPDGCVRVHSFKPCATNLSIASLAFVSCFSENQEIQVFLLEGTEFDQGPVQGSFSSFRTGAVGFLKAHGALIHRADREIPKGIYALRHCFHTERFYLGVLVAGLLAGLEEELLSTLLERGHVQARQYLQEKVVAMRACRVKIEALLTHILALTEGGRAWERAAVELCVLKMHLNADAPAAVQQGFSAVGFEAVLQAGSFQRALRDLQALAYFGGTTELQKLQVFQELAKAEATKRKKAA